jgi:hypothetical protein
MAAIFTNAALLFGGLFAFVMLLGGAVLIGIGLFALQRHRAAANWPQTPAVIEASEVVAERHFEDALMYRPVVRYRYAAPGGSFVGDKLATTGRLYPKEAAARRVSERYPAGTTVMARYNPADPAEAVLERGVSGGFWFVLFGLLCWVVPVALALKAGISPRLIAAVLGILTLIPAALLLRSRSALAEARSRGLCPPAGSGSDADVAALLAQDEKLLAIRLYRELHGGGLKEARLAVEAMGREGRPPGG